MRRLILALAVLVASLAPAGAAQALIPSPYPSGATGAAPLDPEPQGLGGPQKILKDPYPQELGDTAQGNPPIAGHSRHQHLVPSINQRKYGVDQIPTYQ